MRSILLSCFVFMMLVFVTHNKINAQHVGIGTITPLQTLDVNGGLRIGETSTASTGSIRWNETKSDFEGYNGVAWVSLTGGKGKWGDQVSYATENESSQTLLVGGENPGSELGYNIDGNGDWIVAGAYRNGVPTDPSVWSAGSFYLFNRVGDTWKVPFHAHDPDAQSGDLFGFSVSMTSTHIIAGAYGASMPNVSYQGKAYIYTYDPTQLILQATLVASDAQQDDNFGYSVSIDGDYAVVGAPGNDILGVSGMGRAYVFTRTGTVWTQTFVLTPSDGATYDSYGRSVEVWGDYLAVASPNKDINGYNSAGKVYVYKRNGTSWTLIKQLISPNPNEKEFYGYALDMRENKLLIGAPDNVSYIGDSTGLVFLYELNGNDVNYETTLFPSDGKSKDGFGTSVVLFDDVILVGAATADVGASIDQGKAYVFKYSNTEWLEEAKLKSSTDEALITFGKSVSLVPGFAVVAAPLSDLLSRTDNGRLFFFKQY